jgi:chromosome partitioning protein
MGQARGPPLPRRGRTPGVPDDPRFRPRAHRDRQAARPGREDLEALAGGCDLLVIPTTPDALGLDALLATVETLRTIGPTRFKILLTIVPPRPSRDGEDTRTMIDEAGLPRFAGSARRLAVFQKAALAGVIVSEVKDPRAGEA